jgi:serine/threonine protein kinase
MSDDDREMFAADTLAAAVPVGDAGTGVLDLATVERYDELDTIGEGGMGEVIACRDRVIGRLIAKKAMRRSGGAAPRTEARAQFLREARVQGQLEHPAVVPVYDVGREAGDRLFFTMKRVTGDTLASVLDALRSGDAETQRRFGRHRLLAAFQLVCQCIDYAHQRGVVHRDIKPANIMFGDFGEVYVLDWGVARRHVAGGHHARHPRHAERRQRNARLHAARAARRDRCGRRPHRHLRARRDPVRDPDVGAAAPRLGRRGARRVDPPRRGHTRVLTLPGP